MNTVPYVFYLFHVIQPLIGSECFLREFTNNVTIQVKINSVFSYDERRDSFYVGGEIVEVKLCH